MLAAFREPSWGPETHKLAPRGVFKRRKTVLGFIERGSAPTAVSPIQHASILKRFKQHQPLVFGYPPVQKHGHMRWINPSTHENPDPGREPKSRLDKEKPGQPALLGKDPPTPRRHAHSSTPKPCPNKVNSGPLPLPGILESKKFNF